MIAFGKAEAVSVRGTLTVTLDDGREVTVEVAELDLASGNEPWAKSRLILGVDYPEREVDEEFSLRAPLNSNPGAPYLTADVRLKALDPGAEFLYRITIPEVEA
jgi:hypothetical protein